MTPKRALTVLVLLAMSACHLGPAYKAPKLEVPAAYRATPATAKVAWPSADWWRGFNSPELNQLIDEARLANFDIQAAIARVRQADAQVRISGAPLLPTVTGTGSQSYQHASAVATIPHDTTYLDTRLYQLNVGISYEVDLWGGNRAQQESAEASALFSRFDQQTVALTAITSVASTWFQALGDQDRLDVLDHNIHDAREILRAIQGRLDAGIASQLDVAQQATLVAGLLAEVPPLRSDREQQLNGLGILTGHPPESITVRPGTLTHLSLPEPVPGLPSELLRRRPDVAAAEANLIAGNANVKVALANFYPQLSLTGSGGWESAALSTLMGPGAALASFGSSLAQTLFDNGLKGGQYAQARGKYDELVADYRKSVVQAFTDVDNALVAYRYATEQEALERDAVTTAQQAADIARAQLMAGTSDIVTALQAQTTLFTDQDLLVQARLTRVQALLTLYKALGGGWKIDDVAVPDSTVFHGVL
jgi:NodT family efflux transporter outer membrane factor (OMF) lipoprotein